MNFRRDALNKNNLDKKGLNKIIDVKSISNKEREKLKKRIKEFKNKFNLAPTLATILVGEDPGSIYYLKMQKKNLLELSCGVLEFKLREDISTSEVVSLIKDLNSDENVHGIMVLKPLPKSLDEKEITKAISYKKDIDGVTPFNIGLLTSFNEGMVPNTAKSVHKILKSLPFDLKGKNAVILGRSLVLGKPLSQKLLFEDMTITLCHSKTENLKEITKKADVLISAIGKAEYIDETFVKEGASLIDVGTTMVGDKCMGDFNFDRVIEKAGFVTKVPGGVGTLTTTMLIENLLIAAEKIEN